MKTKQQLLSLLEAHKPEIQRRFAVFSIGIFGSHSRGDARADSDVDVLVEFDRPTFDGYMDLKFFLEELFGLSVDLVLADSVKPRLKPVITREVVYA